MNIQTIPNPLLKRSFLTPNRPMLKFNDDEYTFKEMFEMSSKMAGQLQKQGISKGDFVAVLLRNHIDTAVILLSLQLLGGIAVILNNRLTPKELAWQIDDSNSKMLVTEEDFKEKVEPLESMDMMNVRVLWKEQLSLSPFDEPKIEEEVDLDSICTVMYTSGTTGNPKGVLQTYGNHWWSATGSALNLGLKEEDCWLCSVPLFHISGYSILMRSIIYGMKMLLHESFDAKRTIEDIKGESVTIMSIVSTMLTRVVETLGEQTLHPTFRCMLLGGGPAPLPLLEKCVEKNIPVYQTYGMTETSSQIVTLSPEYSLEKLGSAGKPLFPAQLRIVDAVGNEVEANQVGDIIVKGPNVTVGYLNRDDVTRKQILNGWLKTGDVGYVDEEGFLYVKDRRLDLIISGGENIYPAEIEGILSSHPQIIDAGVIGKPDEKWGQVPVAFILKDGDVTKEEIIEYASVKLAKYKLPKEVYFVDSIPRNASRKLLRRELRDMLEHL